MCRCLTFEEMFQGAHRADMEHRRLFNSAFARAYQPILQDKLEECGESREVWGGVENERGRGESE